MATPQSNDKTLRQQFPKEYQCWHAIKQRCFNPNCHAFLYYGGRGITVAPEWCESFEQFFRDLGPAPSAAHSIDRIDNDGNYQPGNCRWATTAEQMKNRRAPKLPKSDEPGEQPIICMPPKEPPRSVPAYCRHKSKNLGYARLHGGDGPPTYFPGHFGSPMSVAAYQFTIEQWLMFYWAGRPFPGPTDRFNRQVETALAMLRASWRFLSTSSFQSRAGKTKRHGNPPSQPQSNQDV